MSKKYTSCHVSTTKRKYNGKVYQAHLVRQSYRDEDGKTKKRTLANLTHLPDNVIELVRLALKGELAMSPENNFQLVRSLPHGNVAAVLGTIKKIRLDYVIGSARSVHRDRCVAMIASRILEAGSKLTTARYLNYESDSATSTSIISYL